jgi:hypothetical protein
MLIYYLNNLMDDELRTLKEKLKILKYLSRCDNYNNFDNNNNNNRRIYDHSMTREVYYNTSFTIKYSLLLETSDPNAIIEMSTIDRYQQSNYYYSNITIINIITIIIIIVIIIKKSF